MFAKRFSLVHTAVLAGAVSMFAAAGVRAQPSVSEPTSPYTSAGPVAAGPLSGYSGKFATPVPGRGPLGAQMVGTQQLRVLEMPSTVYFTSINYPGQYGALTLSVAALTYNMRPDGMNTIDVAEMTDVQSPRAVLTTRVEATPAPLPEKDVARVNVLVPSEAALIFNGVRMPQTGSVREFVTPALETGRDYTYNVRATWSENGREVTRDQVIHVRPGERTDVDFMNPTNATPEGSGTSTLKTRPLL
jgi:uncharacterized protein (TIGR03000 family)